MLGLVSVAGAGPERAEVTLLAEVACFDGLCLPAGSRVDVEGGRLREAHVVGAVRACGTELRGDAQRALHLRAGPDGWWVSGFTEATTIEGMPVRGWISCVDADPPRLEHGVLAGPAVFHGWALPEGFEVQSTRLGWSFADATPERRGVRAVDASEGLEEVWSMSGGTDGCGAEYWSTQLIGEVERSGLVFAGGVAWRRRAAGEAEIVGGLLARAARWGPLEVGAGSMVTARGEVPLYASGDLRFGSWRVEAVKAMFGLPPWVAEASLEEADCRPWTEAPTGFALRVPGCPSCPGWRQSPGATWVYVDARGLPVDHESAWILRDPTARCACTKLRRP